VRDLVRKHDELLPTKAKTEARNSRREAILLERDPGRTADLCAAHVDVEDELRIGLLMELDVEKRLRRVIELVSRAAQTVQVQRDIDMAVRDHLSRHEHEALLRHKKRAIEAELEEPDGPSELEDLTQRLSRLDLNADVLQQVARELKRLARMNPQSGEANVVRTWLECIADLPWGPENTRSERVDLDDARARLNAGHHGLAKVKRRVIEYLCVRKLSKNRRGPILCLAGPPGVGKTTLARSIAETLGREFFRVSLGGVRDDSEIRGHRRTYVGAQPGRIIATLRRAESNNPLILLDELDKLSEPENRGDPSAALLEALDPEQNGAFEDHYLGGPFDLSRVIFICTANDLGGIPGPLRDRLEIIHMSGYTVGEKIQIAEEHLLPREKKNHGLDKFDIRLDAGILESLAAEYTRESGVRNLQRAIASLMRHIAMALVEGGSPPSAVTEKLVLEALGPPRYLDEGMGDQPRIGVVTGLGWTPSGGRLLFIEATRTAGEGKLRLTGRLGDVMQESAKAAMSLIRSDPHRFATDPATVAGGDLHVHLPAGAVPKDGPSAGIGLVTAIASSLSGRPVRNDIAMTGEITLRGQVLPVGGIREKVLAAHRAGIRTILLPVQNRKDEPDIPEAALADLTLHFVHHIDEVLKLALLDVPRVSPAPAA
jgi:ATP-dependent Lon protease